MSTHDRQDQTGATTTGDESAAISTLHAHIAEVRDTIARRAQSNRRRQHVVLGVGAVLAAVVALGMSAVTRLTDQLDAQALAAIGRIEVERRLPDARAALEQHLRTEAPRLVGNGLRSVLDLMPRLRYLLMQDVNHRLDVINDEFKKETLAQMIDVVRATKAQVDAEWPNLNDDEKLEKLVEAVAADYRTNVATLTEDLYPSYEAEMSRITGFLDDLARKKPEELSNEDRMRREIIEITLQLVERGRSPSDASFLSGEVETPAFLKHAIDNIRNNTPRTPDLLPEIEQPETANGTAAALRKPRK